MICVKSESILFLKYIKITAFFLRENRIDEYSLTAYNTFLYLLIQY